MKTPMIEKPTVSEVIFEMIKLRAGDSIPAGWDERARAAIIQHANERAALEAVAKSHEMLLLALNEADAKWLPSTPTSSTFIRKCISAGEQEVRNLAAVRAGNGGAK